MLSCRDLAHKYASDYLDSQLGWRRRVAVWFHLLLCEHCRRFVAQLRRVRGLLRDKPSSDRPDPAAESAAEALGEQLATAYGEQKNTAARK